MTTFSVDFHVRYSFGSAAYLDESAPTMEELNKKLRAAVAKFKADDKVVRIQFERIKRTVTTDVSAPMVMNFRRKGFSFKKAHVPTPAKMKSYGYGKVKFL